VALSEGLGLARRLGHLGSVASQLDGLARIAHARGEAERAAVLLGAADGVRSSIQVAMPPTEAAAHDALVNDLERDLGAELAAEERGRGAEMTLDDAVAFALGPRTTETAAT
jgi:hypothetical protein